MKHIVFMNQALEEAIHSYLNSENEKDGLIYNSFLVVVIRTLALIYSKTDILNPYYLQDKVAFINNLSRYGIRESEITTFLEELLMFKKFEEENKKKKYKEKNPYFTSIQKYLVDFFIAKKKNSQVSYLEEEEFLSLIYTSHTNNYYRISDNYLMSDDPNFIEKYYYTKLNDQEITRVDLNQTIRANLNLDAIKYLGISLSDMNKMPEKDLYNAQSQVYQAFEIDENSLKKDQALKEALNSYPSFNRKVTTGNGYVDILLLMSVIVTSLSVIAIIIFHII